MANPIATREAYLPLASDRLESGMIRGGMFPESSTTGASELNHHFRHPLRLQHDGQTAQHPFHGPASWSTALHLSANQSNYGSITDSQAAISNQSLCLSKGKASTTSDDDESSWKEATDEPQGGKGKRTCPWQRIKWTNEMVKFLINVVNLVGEDGTVESSDGSKRNPSLCQKKGKWRSVSSAMNEAGWHVSPQQCEDKFNDLNKRYKRLNDILGQDVVLRLVENPQLLDSMSNLSPKRKEDVKKLLTSKHSFYKEMHLYHIGFKPLVSPCSFQPSLRSTSLGEPYDALPQVGTARPLQAEYMDKGMNMSVRGIKEDSDCVHACAGSSVDGGPDVDKVPSVLCGDCGRSIDGTPPVSRQTQKCSRDGHASPLLSNDGKEPTKVIDAACSALADRSPLPQTLDMVQFRMMQLEEIKVSLQAQALEIEQQRYKWQVLHSKRDAELERMREDNKKLKYENDQLSYELKQKELEVECKRSVASMALFDYVSRDRK